MSQSKELVAASAAPLVLSILSRGENYGYAIIQEVRKLSNAEIEGRTACCIRSCDVWKDKV